MRAVILCHALMGVPVYFYFTFIFAKGVFKQLESMCRAFLWGSKVDGSPKTSLRAFSEITLPRVMGGLGVRDLRTHALAMLGKDWVKVIAGMSIPWWTLLEHLILKAPIPQLGAISRHVDLETRMQGLPEGYRLEFPRQSTAHSYWRCWMAIREVTTMPPRIGTSPIGFIWFKPLIGLGRGLSPWEEHPEAVKVLMRASVTHYHQLWDTEEDRWFTWRELKARHKWRGWDATHLIMDQLRAIATTRYDPAQETSWRSRRWCINNLPISGKESASQLYDRMSSPHMDIPRLNRHWDVTYTEEEWRTIFKKLWKLALPGKLLYFAWRCIQFALPTRARLATMGVCPPTCLSCGDAEETVPHILGDCTRATETWDKFGPNTYGRDIGIPGGRSRPNLITLIKEAKLKCPISSARICLYVTICHEIWKARNTFIFDQKVMRVPRALCFWKVASFLRATSTEGDTATRAAQLRARALQVVCVVIREVWPRWLGDWDPG